MHEYRVNKKDANLRDLTFHATSLFRQQGFDVTCQQPNQTGAKPQTNVGHCSRLTSQAWTLWEVDLLQAHLDFWRTSRVHPCWQCATLALIRHLHPLVRYPHKLRAWTLCLPWTMLHTVDSACQKSTKRSSVPSSQWWGETRLPAFAKPTLNSCQHALRAETTIQIEEAFVPRTAPIAPDRLRRQTYPWRFQVARVNHRKVMRVQRTESWGLSERL